MKVKNPAGNGQQMIISLDEFTEDTTEADGTECQVVDTASNKVVGYYLAFGGKWAKR